MEKQKILVVDDDKHIAELISLYMMKEGYETQEIYDGKEAAAAVEDFQPDLILLDLMLPGMDAVSYTHLDVYKRQLLTLGRQTALSLRCAI